MSSNNANISKIGLNFDNTFSSLPEILMSKTNPKNHKKPVIAILNNELANNLELNFDKIKEKELSLILSGIKSGFCICEKVGSLIFLSLQ